MTPLPAAIAALVADPWYLEIRQRGPYVPTLVAVAVVVGVGFLAAIAGRRLGCPPVTHEVLLRGVAPDRAYRELLARLSALELRVDFSEPAIRIVGFEGRRGVSYQRIPKEIEVRLAEEPDGTRLTVTVRYLAIVVVDSGEGRYAEDLAARIAGAPPTTAARPGVPLALPMALVADVATGAAMIYLRLVSPAAWPYVAIDVAAIAVVAVVLSVIATLQVWRGGNLLMGRNLALASAVVSVSLLVYWFADYLLYL